MSYDYNTMKYIPRPSERPPGKYKQKLSLLKQMIRDYVHVSIVIFDV